ncbi:hypothetical protein [Butyrivibrio sp. VCB2006]|uniref:hypothetical protein n=1 Tax=Butyrivibrio sp. VCB2006 TaxID=1280679 RepID=UPI0003F94B27|nr:hypothetical protein [Butyrivibrio sp. VCB2006]
MEKEEKIKIAITAGIAGLILLILVLFLALSGVKDSKSDEKALNDNITEYASSLVEADKAGDHASLDASSEDAATESTSSIPYSEYVNSKKGTVSGNSFYETKGAVLKDVYKKITYDTNAQLKEMLTYWEQGNDEAVRDLAHLDRFEAMSLSLSGSNDFYYYGEVNADGLPDGNGIAVYGDDQYYYGHWKDGLRSGSGKWVCFYPSYSQYVVTEHLYTGEWVDDKPNGQGQEHYDYNPDYMNYEDIYLQNAIGCFSNGYYTGEMYIITVDKNYDTKEWLGTCDSGNWIQVLNTTLDAKGRIPVLSERENPSNLLYMNEKKIIDNGVTGIITGGTVKR